MKSYTTHDNGGRPFRVEIDGTKANIYVHHQADEITGDLKPARTDDELIKSATFEEAFIGKSPRIFMTERSGGYGPDFDGNSLLLHLEGPVYMHIGTRVFTFTARSKIIEYVSPVGNNDVPYPYACDTEDNIYLMIEDVVMLHQDGLRAAIREYNDPYSYYYATHKVTRGMLGNLSTTAGNFMDITDWYLDDTKFSLSYRPDPAAEYDRLTAGNCWSSMSIKIRGQKKRPLGKNEFVKIVQEIGREFGFEPLQKIETLHDRRWW